ncbi:MAG: hypothetical protein HY646_01190, partial [Acidobacteria bacterium]|nr:hypothetical protein [Acidobacteriota bacterium]
MKWNFIRPRIIVILLAAISPAMASERLELPSEGLEQRVEFWKKVFTQYGKDDIIIHDRFHVQLIYDVADEDSVRSRTRAVENALDEIRNNYTAPENLSATARQIHDAIVASGIPLSRSTLDELRYNIHT